MKSITINEAQSRLDELLNEIGDGHEPVMIRNQGNSAVLNSETYWRAIQETIDLLSIPGMGESIIEGVNTPVDELVDVSDIRF